MPSLVPPLSASVRRSPADPSHILPLESLQTAGGGRRLQMLSFGHVNPQAGVPGAVLLPPSLPPYPSTLPQGGKTAAMVRGPIASKIVNQLLFATDWGRLDFLVPLSYLR